MKLGKGSNPGILLKEWAELIEDQTGKAQAVQERLATNLKTRNMPEVKLEKVQWQYSSQEAARLGMRTTKAAGYTSIIFVRNHGQDLYVSWRLYQRQVVNWTNIVVFAGIVAPLVSAVIAWRDLLGWVIGFILWLAVALILGVGAGLLAYKGLRREIPIPNVSAQTNEILNVVIGIASPIIALIILTQVLSIPRFPGIPPGFVAIYAAILALGLVGALIGGVITDGNPLAYLFHITTVFDADDSLAMILSVHQSLLRALDQVGVDTSQLRLPHETIEGRVGEAV